MVNADRGVSFGKNYWGEFQKYPYFFYFFIIKSSLNMCAFFWLKMINHNIL